MHGARNIDKISIFSSRQEINRKLYMLPFGIVYLLLLSDRVAVAWMRACMFVLSFLIMPSNSVATQFPFDILFKHGTPEMLWPPIPGYGMCLPAERGHWTSHKMENCALRFGCLSAEVLSLLVCMHASQPSIHCAPHGVLPSHNSCGSTRPMCVWKFNSDFGYYQMLANHFQGLKAKTLHSFVCTERQKVTFPIYYIHPGKPDVSACIVHSRGVFVGLWCDFVQHLFTLMTNIIAHTFRANRANTAVKCRKLNVGIWALGLLLSQWNFRFAQSQFLSALSQAIPGRFVLIFVQLSTPNGCVCAREVERGKSKSDYEWTRNNPMSLISINLFSFAFITAHHRRHRRDTNM